MSYTEALISNMALGHAGVKGRIASLDDKSEEARACKLYFWHAVNVILEMMPWPFATKRVDLQLKGTAYDSWGFAYALPSDCAFAVKIPSPGLRTEPANRKVPFRIVRDPDNTGKLLMTDVENAQLEYNVKVTDPAEFDATFAHAVALLLATLIIPSMRVDAQLAKLAVQNYAAWQAEASGKALRESKEDEVPASEFESVRG